MSIYFPYDVIKFGLMEKNMNTKYIYIEVSYRNWAALIRKEILPVFDQEVMKSGRMI